MPLTPPAYLLPSARPVCSMEESYVEALEQLGGLNMAKPKAMTEILQPLYPHLSLQNVKWHLLAHRRRLERHREMEPAGIAVPTKWTGRQAYAGYRSAFARPRVAASMCLLHGTRCVLVAVAVSLSPLGTLPLHHPCRLEEAYEAAVEAQGGLQAARPKQLLDALQAEFPELTLQVVKWHLQGQRRAKQRGQPSRDQTPSSAGPTPRASPALAPAAAPAAAAATAATGSWQLQSTGSPSTDATGEQQPQQQPLPPPQRQQPPPPHQQHQQHQQRYQSVTPPWQPYLQSASQQALLKAQFNRLHCLEVSDSEAGAGQAFAVVHSVGCLWEHPPQLPSRSVVSSTKACGSQNSTPCTAPLLMHPLFVCLPAHPPARRLFGCWRSGHQSWSCCTGHWWMLQGARPAPQGAAAAATARAWVP